MIRILHVLGKLNQGGAESRIMDLYRHMDRDKVQFDFLVHSDAGGGDLSSDALMKNRTPEYFDDEIRSLGGRIYAVPRFTGTNYRQYKRALQVFFSQNHDWTAIEGHMTSTAAIYLPVAKAAGVPVTIAHARSGGVAPGLKGAATRLLRRNLARKADLLYSCAKQASEAVFGARAVREGLVEIIPNAVDTGIYAFDETTRRAVRKELGIPEDAFVIGHVGRFDEMKNQAFLVDVLAACGDKVTGRSPYLLFVGDGKLRESVREKAKTKGLSDRVLFAGRCSADRTAAMYQVFDVFALPSYYEGLPGTAIEAQAAGLPCLISDRVTKESAVTPQVDFLSIEDAGEWAKAAVSAAGQAEISLRTDVSRSAQEMLTKAGYDAGALAAHMQEKYLSFAKKQILLIAPSLRQGGLERVCVRTARLLAAERADMYQVHIALFDGRDAAYDTTGLDVTDLKLPSRKGAIGKVLNLERRRAALRKLKKRLRIDISYSLGQTANLAGIGARAGDRIICGIRSYQDFDNPEKLRRFARKADLIACCSRQMERDFADRFHPERSCTVYNPINTSIGGESDAVPEGKITAFLNTHPQLIMSMGRCDRIKGFWHLIKAFAVLRGRESAKGFSSIAEKSGLIIIGAGDFRAYAALADALGIGGDVLFTGLLTDPFPLLKKARLYALTSYHEGFPNALVEALALGVPAIAADCRTGPAEILTDDADCGVLIPLLAEREDLNPAHISEEEKELALRMEEILSDPVRWERMHENAPRRAAAFSDSAYVEALDNMFRMV